MDGTADSPQHHLPNAARHEAVPHMFIEVPDQHGVTEVFSTDYLFRTHGDDAAFTDLTRSIATSLGIPQPGVLYFEYNKRATSGPGLLGLLREVSERGLDYVVVDWERSVRVAGCKRSCSPAVQGGEEGRQKIRRESPTELNEEQDDALLRPLGDVASSRSRSRRSSTSTGLFVRKEATRAPEERQERMGSMLFGAPKTSQIIDLGSPSASSEDSESEAWSCNHGDGDGDFQEACNDMNMSPVSSKSMGDDRIVEPEDRLAMSSRQGAWRSDNVSSSIRNNSYVSREETVTPHATAAKVRSESLFTSPSKPAAALHLGKRFNLPLFRQKAALKQKDKARDEREDEADAVTSTIQATYMETEPAKPTPEKTTPTSAPSNLSPEAPSLFNQAPLEREQMGDYGYKAYNVKDRPLRFPDRWYASAGMNPPMQKVINLIMETSWGEQKQGADRCSRCAKLGLECWVLTDAARDIMIDSPSAASFKCARCRPWRYKCSFKTEDRAGPSQGLDGSCTV